MQSSRENSATLAENSADKVLKFKRKISYHKPAFTHTEDRATLGSDLSAG